MNLKRVSIGELETLAVGLGLEKQPIFQAQVEKRTFLSPQTAVTNKKINMDKSSKLSFFNKLAGRHISF